MSEFYDDAPQWVVDLYDDLETMSARGDCTHERSAYGNAAQHVKDYWKRRGMHD